MLLLEICKELRGHYEVPVTQKLLSESVVEPQLVPKAQFVLCFDNV